MNPNDNDKNNYSVDYLNQIATPIEEKTKLGSKIFIGGVILLGVIVIFLIGTSIVGGYKSPDQQIVELNIRLNAIQDISKKNQRKLRDSSIRSFNSSLTLQTSTAINNLEAVMAKRNIKEDKYKKKIDISKELITKELGDKLEEAELNIMLDRAYAREMTYQIGLIRSSINSIKRHDNSPEMKTFLENNEQSLSTLETSFNEFQGSN